MDVRKLLIDDFFEVANDPFVYSVDLVHGRTVIATNCQTGEMVAFPKEMRVVDFLYR